MGCQTEAALTFHVASMAGLFETPLLAALPLFATGLGAMGLFAWWKKKENPTPVRVKALPHLESRQEIQKYRQPRASLSVLAQGLLLTIR